MNDCIACHFSFEERELFPHIPAEIRERLEKEHAWLKRNDYPASSVIRHSEREVAIFRRWCPPALVAEAEADHRNFHAVLEDHALRGRVAPTEPISTQSTGTCCTKCKDSHEEHSH